MSEETTATVPPPVHRSPMSFEVVEPVDPTVDKRSLPENVAKRIAGHKRYTEARKNGITLPSINRQAFENSPLANHPVVEAWKNDPDRLFNDLPPNMAIIHEKPEHRIAVYLKAQGVSDKDICERLDYTRGWFSQLKRQPWFKLRLVQELRDAGKDAIADVIKGAALDSVFTLIDIRDSLQVPAAVRKAAAADLLDRYLGKPVAKIETTEKPMPSTEDIRKVDQEIKDIDQQLLTSAQSKPQMQ